MRQNGTKSVEQFLEQNFAEILEEKILKRGARYQHIFEQMFEHIFEHIFEHNFEQIFESKYRSQACFVDAIEHLKLKSETKTQNFFFFAPHAAAK
jgi:hypothetical protein